MNPEKPEQQTPSSLREIKAIEKSGIMIRNKDQLTELIETPLLKACATLYDKNIRTIFSSANQKDIEAGVAYIIIDFGSLSPENQKIAKSLGQQYEREGGQHIKIEIPVSNTSTVSEIEQAAQAIADKFQSQPMTWAPTYTLEQLKKVYGIPKDDTQFDNPKSWEEGGQYFYDEENKLFYLSQEHYKKANENL